MKKLIPILTLIGSSALFVGCDAMMNTNAKDYNANIKDFKESVAKYNQTKPENIIKTVGNYNLNIIDRDNDISLLEDNIEKNTNETNNEINTLNIDENLDDIMLPNDAGNINNNDTSYDLNKTDLNKSEIENNLSQENTNLQENNTQISTLYSLSNDIEESCNEFCELKTKILDAIAESENLSQKLKNNELTLTREQRLFVNEQSSQLKNLSRQLSNATNELSFNLSDLNAIMKENNQDLDSLSLKYLIVLDNLINGNEMLQNGLSSLNLINNMMQINSRDLPSNNHSKILYGFQENDNEPTIKEYTINEQGELEGKTLEQNETELENVPNNEKTSTKKTNIDTYKNTKFASNIDTYGNNRRNIDTFFNTALFDNDFMYGNNNAYGGMYGNPNLYQYQGYEKYNELNNQTNNNFNNSLENEKQKTNQQKKKKFKLKSNIDTYRDENTPDIKTKIKNFKSSINNFFNRAKIGPKNKIQNPIYKLED